MIVLRYVLKYVLKPNFWLVSSVVGVVLSALMFTQGRSEMVVYLILLTVFALVMALISFGLEPTVQRQK